MLGLINTMYTVGAIIAGFFFVGPVADYLGGRAEMGIGALFVILSTFLQCFAPKGNIGMFMEGRVSGDGWSLGLTRPC